MQSLLNCRWKRMYTNSLHSTCWAHVNRHAVHSAPTKWSNAAYSYCKQSIAFPKYVHYCHGAKCLQLISPVGSFLIMAAARLLCSCFFFVLNSSSPWLCLLTCRLGNVSKEENWESLIWMNSILILEVLNWTRNDSLVLVK